MKKTIFTLVFCFASITAIWAQSPTPTPIDDDGVVKITTALIQVDVSVTDKDGKQITDLKPEDFEILENGDKQEITNFSYVAVSPDVRAQTQNQITANSKQIKVPPIPTQLRADQVRRTIVLVVDDIGMSLASLAHVRDTLKKFVAEQMQEGDLVAIIRTSAGISVFQQFTSDKRILRAAIERVKWNAFSGKLGLFEPVEQTFANGNTTESFDKEIEQRRQSLFAVGSLGAMRYVINGMSELPGRKTMIVFSEGFDIFDGTVREKNPNAAIMQQAMEELIETANRAGVIVNTIDARGLQVPGMFTAEDDLRDQTMEQREAVQQGRTDAFRESQSGLSVLAERTGGRSFFNTNGLSDAVRKATEDQNGYYLIAYQPDTETFDANKRRFNKLSVRVRREGVNVRFRSGFFNVSDERMRPTNQTTAQTPQQKMSDALFSPFGASGITMRMTSVFANDIKEGNFVRAFLHIDGKSITFTDEANGSKKVSFDVIGYTFGEKGDVVDSFGKSYSISVKAENVQKIIEKGLVYSMLVPIKKSGAYQLRVAVRDMQSDKIGAATQFIEIPNLDKNRLALSGLILQNMTIEQWQAKIGGTAQTNSEMQDAQTVTATRIFRRGSVLLYNYVVYNAKPAANRNAQIQTQARLYRDGQLVFEGKLLPLKTAGQTDLKRLEGNGSMTLGKNLAAGDYVLQIVVVDALAKDKNQVQAQFIDFELID